MAAARTKPAPEVPVFTSDRLRLLAPLITPEVMDLAYRRLTHGHGSILTDGETPNGERKSTIKLALLIVHEMNPYEKFPVYEEAVMRGMGKDAVNPAKKDGQMRPL